jgi:molecular chaperone DnaJ
MLDPHEVLGVARGASHDALHRAFRRAVRRHHPDLNPTDPAAAERLRAVVFAYQTLRSARPAAASIGAPVRVACHVRGADLLGVLRTDAAPGGWILVELAAADTCPSCRGLGWEQVAASWGRVDRWECDACRGAGIVRAERRVRLRIPEQAADGTRVRLRGIGLSRPGLARGDAWLTLRSKRGAS